jgi:polyisoprenoid-binding protein YceI
MKRFFRKHLRWIAIAFVAVVVLTGGAFYWMLSGSSAAPLALQARASLAKNASATELNGQWRVVPGPADQATTAGYRVKEKVAGGIATDTATGRTGDVTGSVTVINNRVTAATFTVNMTALKSDKSLRDSVLKTVGIQTSKYPTAGFTLTIPIALPSLSAGKIYQVTAHGTLRLHGVSKAVSLLVHCEQTDTGFVVLANMPITMSDFGIKAPSIGGVVSVEHHGSFELLANLAR